MRKNNVIVVIGLFLMVTQVFAQKQLSHRAALELALKNNFSVLLAKKQAELAANNTGMGAAGMLPNVNVGANGTYSLTNTHQEFVDGRVVDRKGAKAMAVNYFATLNWTIFNGFRLVIAYDRLEEQERLGNEQAKAIIQQSLASVSAKYFDIVRIKKLVESIKQALQVSEQRVLISKTRFDLGKASKLEWLQAKVLQSAQKAQLLDAEQTLLSIRADLTQLLGLKEDSMILVTDSIAFSSLPPYNELKSEAISNSPQLKTFRIQERISLLQLRENRALRAPIVNLNASYVAARSATQAGLLLNSNTDGPSIGVSAVLPIFLGHSIQRNISNAKINLDYAKLNYQDQELKVVFAVNKAYNSYLVKQQQFVADNENLALARELLAASLERYKLGNLSGIELKDAQTAILQAESQRLNSMYALKSSEIDLLLLAGLLE